MSAKRRRKDSGSGDSGVSSIGNQSVNGQSSRIDPDDETNGHIVRVELVDFMNHARLDLPLSPRVNVITGRNGAGKSSVLQAIVLALGGDARQTKRATGVASFVRRGCNKAEVRVTLSNAGRDPFRPEVYGSAIVMERVIYKAGSYSVHAVKCERSKIRAQKGTSENLMIQSIYVSHSLSFLVRRGGRREAADPRIFQHRARQPDDDPAAGGGQEVLRQPDAQEAVRVLHRRHAAQERL